MLCGPHQQVPEKEKAAASSCTRAHVSLALHAWHGHRPWRSRPYLHADLADVHSLRMPCVSSSRLAVGRGTPGTLRTMRNQNLCGLCQQQLIQLCHDCPAPTQGAVRTNNTSRVIQGCRAASMSCKEAQAARVSPKPASHEVQVMAHNAQLYDHGHGTHASHHGIHNLDRPKEQKGVVAQNGLAEQLEQRQQQSRNEADAQHAMEHLHTLSQRAQSQ